MAVRLLHVRFRVRLSIQFAMFLYMSMINLNVSAYELRGERMAYVVLESEGIFVALTFCVQHQVTDNLSAVGEGFNVVPAQTVLALYVIKGDIRHLRPPAFNTVEKLALTNNQQMQTGMMT